MPMCVPPKHNMRIPVETGPTFIVHQFLGRAPVDPRGQARNSHQADLGSQITLANSAYPCTVEAVMPAAGAAGGQTDETTHGPGGLEAGGDLSGIARLCYLPQEAAG